MHWTLTGSWLDATWTLPFPKRDLKKLPSPWSGKVRSGNYLRHFSNVSGLRKGKFLGTMLESILETTVTHVLHKCYTSGGASQKSARGRGAAGSPPGGLGGWKPPMQEQQGVWGRQPPSKNNLWTQNQNPLWIQKSKNALRIQKIIVDPEILKCIVNPEIHRESRNPKTNRESRNPFIWIKKCDT